jgi:hypothetical protein
MRTAHCSTSSNKGLADSPALNDGSQSGDIAIAGQPERRAGESMPSNRESGRRS